MIFDDCTVAEVARLHSYQMCVREELEHVLDGRNLGGRLKDWLGWDLGADYATFGENITWWDDLVDAEVAFVEEEPPCDAVDGGHRLNILDRDFRYLGVGYCHCTPDPYGNFYLTQAFITYDPAQVFGSNPYCGW